LGTGEYSWNAMPPSNWTAHGSQLRNGTDHHLWYFCTTLNAPTRVGVPVAPVDTWSVRTTRLFSIASVTWRSSSTSARRPLPVLRGVGRLADWSRARVSGPMTPSRPSRSHF
jgi:hypothetical protein